MTDIVEHNTADQNSPPRTPGGSLSALEFIAGVQLSNRYIWLIVILTLLNIAMLTAAQLHYQRFDTLNLMSIIGLFIELALFSSVLVIYLATPVTVQRWQAVFPETPFSYPLNGLALSMNACLLLIVLLVPVMYVHRYPELATTGIRIPLMMLQRELLVLFATIISANIMLIARHVLRMPFAAGAGLGLLTQLAIGYYVTYLSFTTESYIRLNDVFYYNQLGKRFDWFPDLLTGQVFHNMEIAYFAKYLLIAIAVWLVTFLLWIPASLHKKPPA